MADEELGSPSTEESSPPPKSKKVSKRRLRRRRWIWTLAVLVILCFLINGPIARWLVLYGLNKGLEKQGLSGNAEISGTLSQGVSIQNLSYTGDKGIQSLNIKEVAANYRLTEIVKGKIRSALLTKANIVIDIDKFPIKEKKDEEALNTDLRKTLKKLHSWISQPEITVSNLDVQVLRSGEKQAHFLLSKLHHQAGFNEFIITGFQATDREQRTTPIQNTTIQWTPETASLDRFELLPGIAAENVELEWSSYLEGQGQLTFLDTRIDIQANNKITAKLSQGYLDSDKISQRFDIHLPADFKLADMDISIENWKQPIPYWSTDAKLHLTSAKYEDYQISDAHIQLTQKDSSYHLKIDSSVNESPIQAKISGKWLSPDQQQWWSDTTAEYDVRVPKLGTLANLIENIPEKIQIQETAITAQGILELRDLNLTKLNIEAEIDKLSANQVPLPSIKIKSNYLEGGQTKTNITARSNHTTALTLDVDYQLNSQDYEASLTFNESSPEWINALAQVFETAVSLKGPTTLAWKGKGNVKDIAQTKSLQTGKLNIETLQIDLPEKPTINISADIDYRWPESISLPSLSVTADNWHGMANLAWDGKVINITGIEVKQNDQQLASLQGKIPFNEEINSLETFLKQTAPWDLTVKTKPITFSKLTEWIKNDSLKQISGNTALDIQLKGSPNQPQLKGSAHAKEIELANQDDLQLLHLSIDFHTKNDNIILTGKLLESKTERLSLNSKLPFTPSKWIEDPDLVDTFLTDTPISAEAKINTLPLGRFKSLAPELESIDGTISGKATLGGTFSRPTYLIDLDADIPSIRLKKSEIGEIRDIKLNAKLTDNRKATTQLTAQINGGEFTAGGTVDLNNPENPIFDLYLRTQYALIHRDDTVSVRANSNIKLLGTMEDATLSGSIGIAESLFYKDIELIPIGVPSSEVAKVNMPALSKRKADDRLPVPEPFANWKLDLVVRMDDPFLIRGNVAKGNLTGSVKVGGTIAKPAPLGTVYVNNVKAKLPFSILEIARGEIKFSPSSGLDPKLNIQGKSTINSYDVNLFAYGQASSPKTTFTSNPPLPETEVMTLLATGTTTSDLENPSVATFKALQVFLMKLQQRNDNPKGNKLFKALLSGVDDLNLNVGETDPFTGRKFTSGTIALHPQWNLTAQVDDTQETRGLIVYVIRFR